MIPGQPKGLNRINLEHCIPLEPATPDLRTLPARMSVAVDLELARASRRR